MPPVDPWPGARRIDESWGTLRLCRTCSGRPSDSTLRVDESGFLCGKHDPLPDGPAIRLEDAAAEAWPESPLEQQHTRVGTARTVVLAVQNGARYISPEGLAWAWDLWKAAVRIDARRMGSPLPPLPAQHPGGTPFVWAGVRAESWSRTLVYVGVGLTWVVIGLILWRGHLTWWDWAECSGLGVGSVLILVAELRRRDRIDEEEIEE